MIKEMDNNLQINLIPAFQKGCWFNVIYVSMFLWSFTYIKYIFHVKIENSPFSDVKVWPDRISVLMWVPWVRNQIRIEANADLQHWFLMLSC